MVSVSRRWARLTVGAVGSRHQPADGGRGGPTHGRHAGRARKPDPGGGALLGYNLSPGSPVTLSLVWQSLAPLDQDYTVFVHILDDNTGQLVAQADRRAARRHVSHQPVAGRANIISDEYQFNLPPGRYTAQVGLVPARERRAPGSARRRG